MVANSNSPQAEESRPRHVLVIEDDERLNNPAQRALREAGVMTPKGSRMPPRPFYLRLSRNRCLGMLTTAR